jgi:hypothetical protein
MAETKMTTDHDEIRQWVAAEAREHGVAHASRHHPHGR